jgi:osmotically inducible protein OsmC
MMERNTSMAEKYRKAGVLWTGDLRNGNGIVSTESKALFEYPFTYRMRFEDDPGTNPEELIAAAHAACFSMSIAKTLAKNGYDPVRTDTTATCILAPRDSGGHEITGMQLHVRAEVPGIDEETFEKMIVQADEGCPVSNLLRNGLEIEIDATLLQDDSYKARSPRL